MQRLSGTDSLFLAGETRAWHQHVAGLAVVDPTGVPGFGYDAIRKTVEAEIRRMRWGEQGFRDVAYGQRIEPRYPIEDCRHAVARFLENYMRDYIRELRSLRKDANLKTVPQPQQGD